MESFTKKIKIREGIRLCLTRKGKVIADKEISQFEEKDLLTGEVFKKPVLIEKEK